MVKLDPTNLHAFRSNNEDPENTTTVNLQPLHAIYSPRSPKSLTPSSPIKPYPNAAIKNGMADVSHSETTVLSSASLDKQNDSTIGHLKEALKDVNEAQSIENYDEFPSVEAIPPQCWIPTAHSHFTKPMALSKPKSESPPITVSVNLSDSGLSIHRGEKIQAQLNLPSTNSHASSSTHHVYSEDILSNWERLKVEPAQSISPEKKIVPELPITIITFRQYEEKLHSKFRYLSQLATDIDLLKANVPFLEPGVLEIKCWQTLKSNHSSINAQFENNFWFLQEMKDLCNSWKSELEELQDGLKYLENDPYSKNNATASNSSTNKSLNKSSSENKKSIRNMYRVSSSSSMVGKHTTKVDETGRPNVDPSNQPRLKKSFTTRMIETSKLTLLNSSYKLNKGSKLLKRGASDTALISNRKQEPQLESGIGKKQFDRNKEPKLYKDVDSPPIKAFISQNTENLPWQHYQHDESLTLFKKVTTNHSIQKPSSPKDEQLKEIVEKRLKRQRKLKSKISNELFNELSPLALQRQEQKMNSELRELVKKEKQIAEESKERLEKIRDVRLGSIRGLSDDALKKRLADSLYSLNSVEDRLANIANKIALQK